MNMSKENCMHVWKSHNETHYYLPLTYTNKLHEEKKILAYY
jgi:hypothetical protein